MLGETRERDSISPYPHELMIPTPQTSQIACETSPLQCRAFPAWIFRARRRLPQEATSSSARCPLWHLVEATSRAAGVQCIAPGPGRSDLDATGYRSRSSVARAGRNIRSRSSRASLSPPLCLPFSCSAHRRATPGSSSPVTCGSDYSPRSAARAHSSSAGRSRR